MTSVPPVPASLLGAGAALVLLAGAAARSAAGGAPALVWNTTASAPLGLYTVRPSSRLQVGQWVVVRPSPRNAAWLDARGYLPRGALLVKRIAAAPGDTVCRRGSRVSIGGRAAGQARVRDRRGRLLPSWHGCARLAQGAVFLMNSPSDSLDGRYFGPTPRDRIVGRAAPLWLRGRL